MANHMNCPECEHPFGYSPALVGKTIRCRQCQFTFTVKAAPSLATAPPPPVTTPAPETPTPPPVPTAPPMKEPPPMPAKVVEDREEVRRTRRREEQDRRADDDEYDRPHSKRRRDRDEDDERNDDRPRSRSRANRYADEEDVNDREEARPKRSRKESSSSGAMLGIIIGVGLVLLLGGGLIVYAAWPSSKSSPTEPVIVANTPTRPNDPGINVRPAWPNNPKQAEPPNLNDLLNKGPKINPNPPVDVPPKKKQRPEQPPVPSLRGLSERKEITLDGDADTVVAGGGNKFLCVLQPTAKKVAIIDVAQGKIVKTIDVVENTKIAAGKQYLYLLDPSGGDMERWDWTKLERPERRKFANASDVRALAMGADSDGPLVVAMQDRKSPHLNAQIHYVDAKTYTDFNYRVEGEGCPHGIGLTNRPIMLAVSADGKNVTASTKDWPMGPQIDRLSDGMVRRSWKHIPVEPMRPCNDGAHLCSVNAIYDYNLKVVGKKDGDPFNPTWFIPAVDGHGYLALNHGPNRRLGIGKQPLFMEIRQTGSEQLLLDVGQVPDLKHDSFGAGRHALTGHALFFHGPKMLALISSDQLKTVVIYRVTLAW